MTGTVMATGVDVGGTAIKIGAVDVDPAGSAEPNVGEISRHPTPPLAEPDVIVAMLAPAIEAAVAGSQALGIAVCGHVDAGTVTQANNLGPSWRGVHLQDRLAVPREMPVAVLNDADAAAFAEAPFCRDVRRTLYITCGTGIGTALIEYGRVLERFELASAEVDGVTIDEHASTRHADNGEPWPTWAGRVDRVLAMLSSMVRPDLIIVGGGASERWDDWHRELTSPVSVRPAHFTNRAGVIGAALAACEGVT